MINKNIESPEVHSKQSSDSFIEYYNSPRSKKISQIIESLDAASTSSQQDKIKELNQIRRTVKLNLRRKHYKDI